jgi:hypothetical protein
MAKTQIKPLFGDKPGTWRKDTEGEAHGFASDPGLRHFFLQHKAALVDAGAVTLLRGRWWAVEPLMTQAVLRIAQQQARLAVGLERA